MHFLTTGRQANTKFHRYILAIRTFHIRPLKLIDYDEIAPKGKILFDLLEVEIWKKKRKSGGPKAGQLELSHSSPKLSDIIEIIEDRRHWNPAVLHQKYIVEKATMAQIAKELLCSKNAVRSALIRAGIPIRKGVKNTGYGVKAVRGRPAEASSERKVIDTIIELRDGGMSFDTIAHFLTKMGVPTKTRRKKWNGGCVRVIYLRHRQEAAKE